MMNVNWPKDSTLKHLRCDDWNEAMANFMRPRKEAGHTLNSCCRQAIEAYPNIQHIVNLHEIYKSL